MTQYEMEIWREERMYRYHSLDLVSCDIPRCIHVCMCSKMHSSPASTGLATHPKTKTLPMESTRSQQDYHTTVINTIHRDSTL